MISKSYDMILLRYEVHDTIFTVIFKKKKKVHFESSKLRGPTHVRLSFYYFCV